MDTDRIPLLFLFRFGLWALGFFENDPRLSKTGIKDEKDSAREIGTGNSMSVAGDRERKGTGNTEEAEAEAEAEIGLFETATNDATQVSLPSQIEAEIGWDK